MSSNNKVANDFSDIARRMRELGCTSDEPNTLEATASPVVVGTGEWAAMPISAVGITVADPAGYGGVVGGAMGPGATPVPPIPVPNLSTAYLDAIRKAYEQQIRDAAQQQQSATYGAITTVS